MLNKGFLRNRDPEKKRFSTMMTNLALYAGVCIILTGLFFMILNIDQADSMIHVWSSLMIAGVVLVFLSFLIKLNREWHHK